MTYNQNPNDFVGDRVMERVETFNEILLQRPTLLGLIGRVSAGEYATDPTYIWTEYVSAPLSWLVGGTASTIGSATVDVVDATGIVEGMILEFERPASSGVNPNGSYTVQAKVLSIAGNTLTIERIGTDEEIEANSKIGLVSRPEEEGSLANEKANVKPYTQKNYTEIFRNDVKWVGTLDSTALHALGNDARKSPVMWDSFQLKDLVEKLNRQLGKSILKGIGEERDATHRGRMNGIVTMLEAQGATVDAAYNAITADMINDASSTVATNGGLENSLKVIVCGKDQARKLSSFNVSGNNPVVMRPETTTGSYVHFFQTDLAGTNGGALMQIIVDENMDKDKVILLNTDAVKLVPMVKRDWFELDSTPAGYDGIRRGMLGEFTMKFVNAKANGIVIENLQVV